MTLGEKQRLFARLVAGPGGLVSRALELGFDVAFGAAERSIVEQRAAIASGASRLRGDPSKGAHVRRVAVDLHLYRDGFYQRETEDHRELGEWWERFHPLARWGGRWGDGNHYSLEHEGVR